MALTEQNTLWREQNDRVKITSVWRAVCVALQGIKPRRHPHIKDINAHYARDIGLSASDIAYHQHRMPSQHTHHPRG